MKFSELTNSAKDTAFDNFVQSFDAWDWQNIAEELIAEQKQDIEEVTNGYDIEIQYSGFYSQGDGASFTGYLNIKTMIVEILVSTSKYPLLMYIIKNNDLNDDYVEVYRTDNHHSHEKTVKVGEVELSRSLSKLDSMVNHEVEELRNEMQSWVEESSKNLYAKLKDAYESEANIEAYAKYAEDEKLDFDEDGNLQ